MGQASSIPILEAISVFNETLEGTTAIVFLCGTLVVFFFVFHAKGIFRFQHNPNKTRSALDEVTNNSRRDRNIQSSTDSVCSTSSSHNSSQSSTTARSKSIVSGMIPKNNASSNKESKSLFTGVIPFGDEQMSNATLSKKTNVSTPDLMEAEQVVWKSEDSLSVINEEEVSMEHFEDLEANMVRESLLDELTSCDLDLFETKAKMVSREELVEMGESLLLLGEMLHFSGKRVEALQVFERASFVHKLVINESMQTIASHLHEVGVYHRDRGDDWLSVVLTGTADLLHEKPLPKCLQICTQVLKGYRRSSLLNSDLEELMKRMNENLDIVRREAKPLALSLRGQAHCLSE